MHGDKRARIEQADSNQAQANVPGREQLLLASLDLQARLGRKYCDEAELVPLLLEHGFVRRARTIEVEMRPLGGDSFRVTLDCDKPLVGVAKTEIARIQGTKESRQELYRVAVRADGKAVREDDAEPELLEDDTMLLGGDVVTAVVKEEEMITIVVWNHTRDGQNCKYLVPESTRMQIVFETYAQRWNIELHHVRFRFLMNDVFLENNQTPASLGMKDMDTIGCMITCISLLPDSEED
jgi:hypothetical protein